MEAVVHPDDVKTPAELLQWCQKQARLNRQWSEDPQQWEDPDDQWFFLGVETGFNSVARILEKWQL